jgi:uridine phosphorylase
MVFPNFPNKHLEEALFHPSDFIKYKKLDGKKFPKSYILIYDKKLLGRIKRMDILKKLDIPLVHVDAYQYKGIGLVRMAGIGSPHATTIFEELIGLGGRNFLNIGTAGGLQQEGIFLCEKSVRDEGTSSHYLVHEKYAYPDKTLTSNFARNLEKSGLEFKRATSWTIDAPYRETKAEIIQYKKEGVATVEMESSALFAVAKLRKVKIASAFAVSDVLGEKWEPKFHHINLKKSLDRLVIAGFDCLLELK